MLLVEQLDASDGHLKQKVVVTMLPVTPTVAILTPHLDGKGTDQLMDTEVQMISPEKLEAPVSKKLLNLAIDI